VEVFGSSDFAPDVVMTLLIDGFVLEAPMTDNASRGRFEYNAQSVTNLSGRRVLISTDHGGSYNSFIGSRARGTPRYSPSSDSARAATKASIEPPRLTASRVMLETLPACRSPSSVQPPPFDRKCP